MSHSVIPDPTHPPALGVQEACDLALISVATRGDVMRWCELHCTQVVAESVQAASSQGNAGAGLPPALRACCLLASLARCFEMLSCFP